MAAGFDWEAEGIRLGETLDHYHALLVVGTDDEATAHVAIGIGRAQAPRRRVAVGDLIGEAAPFQSLIDTDDPHGIVDSFVYGVSLNRIARDVPGTPGLYVMPTGTEPLDPAEVFPNARWRRLASGFREMGALLVLTARADAPAIDALAAQVDGVVLVGEDAPRALPVAAVLAVIRRPAPPIAVSPLEMPALPSSDVPVVAGAARARWPVRTIVRAGLALLLLTAIGVWFAARPWGSATRPYAPRPDTTRPVSAIVPGSVGAGGADSTGALVVANPRDSAIAVGFAVELLAANTLAGAAARVREEGDRAPASTFTPAIVDGAEWFKVVAGAYATRAAADSLLGALRQRGLLDARSGSVVRLPYAYLVHSAVTVDKVGDLLNAYRDLGQPVYALEQADGTLNIYSGAFETPEQAARMVESLRAVGITPTLVFRTGRVL